MKKVLSPIDVTLIKDNVFDLIANQWFLITAGKLDSFNTMTASWGAFGELWNKKIAICFVRPVRYTYEFTEREDYMTFCFFGEEHRDVLKVCGSKSGRDIDKMAGIGLTPVEGEAGSVYFKEAKLVLECRKIYTHDIDPKLFLDPAIDLEYPQKDYHRMYIGEIVRCLVQK